MVVRFDAPPADDIVDGWKGSTCTPSSGSQFPIGETTVRCEAADRAGNTGATAFTVRVRDEAPPDLTLPVNRDVVTQID